MTRGAAAGMPEGTAARLSKSRTDAIALRRAVAVPWTNPFIPQDDESRPSVAFCAQLWRRPVMEVTQYPCHMFSPLARRACAGSARTSRAAGANRWAACREWPAACRRGRDPASRVHAIARSNPRPGAREACFRGETPEPAQVRRLACYDARRVPLPRAMDADRAETKTPLSRGLCGFRRRSGERRGLSYGARRGLDTSHNILFSMSFLPRGGTRITSGIPTHSARRGAMRA